MSKHVPNIYGFTAAPRQMSFARIAREAKANKRFIVTQIKNTQTNKEFVGVLIRKDSLPSKQDGLTLLGKPLSKRVGKTVGNFRFLLARGKGVSAQKIANKVKNDLRTLQNHLDKRVLRVVVETL